MDATLLSLARDAPGFMPEQEGLALHDAALRAARRGPLLEIGSYCGKSTVYLGAAARACGSVVFTVDHHRGSEENQPGELYHDGRFDDPHTGGVDTLPCFRRTITVAGLDDCVIAVIGRSAAVARHWGTPLGLVFIDGGHTDSAAQSDYEGWAPHLAGGGLLVIHDVFADPAAGGQAPYRVWVRALGSGAFREESRCGSLQVLRRVGDGI